MLSIQMELQLYTQKKVIPQPLNYYLKKGADAIVKDKDGNTALHWAALNDHTETVKLLLERGLVLMLSLQMEYSATRGRRRRSYQNR